MAAARCLCRINHGGRFCHIVLALLIPVLFLVNAEYHSLSLCPEMLQCKQQKAGDFEDVGERPRNI